ncbi:probable E3 ubiquitin-protein ligase hip1 [Phtheirospermum japonicum]|uniref:RING-type E3 ubiquitin transferase n=1 Tax=Phtheirospermum japonicum TaxID=374723 RepID=A0A830AXD9_9LAMI|nr:probable E3 ubiquitin-protein ligase hip1 [Phtheirospermum japonicum]
MYYGAPRQHPGPNLDLAITTPSGHYNPYLAPPFVIRDIPTPPPNHGGIVGGSFKRKNTLAGPSSSVPSSSESDVITFVQPESAVLGRNNGHLIQGGFVAPPPVVGLPGGNPWPDVHFGSNSGDVGAFGWTHAPIPYVHHASPFAQGHHPNPLHHHHHQPPPMQGARGYNNVNLPSPQISSSNSGINHHQFQDVVDVRPTFVAPHVPPTGFRLYRPQQREIVFDSSARTHTSPFLRMLPEDEVAILEFPGYHDVVGDSMDQHRDMRLDIDHMSYEELLALEEQIGCVGTGLPEGFIRNYLKIRTFTPSPARLNLEGQTCPNLPINFCVICQTDYENKDKLGTIDCGHEYHKECIKKWLLLKNTCPVCKSTALGRKPKDL